MSIAKAVSEEHIVENQFEDASDSLTQTALGDYDYEDDEVPPSIRR